MIDDVCPFCNGSCQRDGLVCDGCDGLGNRLEAWLLRAHRIGREDALAMVARSLGLSDEPMDPRGVIERIVAQPHEDERLRRAQAYRRRPSAPDEWNDLQEAKQA